jgi:hypothetical protein
MKTYESHELQVPPPPDLSWLRPWRPIYESKAKVSSGSTSYDGMSKAAAVQQRIDERMERAREWTAAHPTPEPPPAPET